MESATGALNDIKASSSALFEANLNVQQSNIAFQRQKQMADYNANLDIKKNQVEFDQKIAQQAQLMNDPATAITSVMDEYKKLGIPFTSTVQSRLAEFKASGKTLPDFLTEMSKNIQASPAYQQYSAKKAGE